MPPAGGRSERINRIWCADAVLRVQKALKLAEYRHETSPPTIPASGSGRCRAPGSSRVARAQTYPSRPVHIVVGFPAGGASDIMARLIGQWLSERLGQQFVVDNRPGAGGNIATEAVVRAPPDGYTLLVGTLTNAINATLYDKLNFDFIRDIAPVASIDRVPLVMDGQSIGAGQDGPRVHRLRQGQSRQDQHGVGRQRQRRNMWPVSCSR